MKTTVKRRTRRNGHKYDVYTDGVCVGGSSTRAGADKLAARAAAGKISNLKIR